MKYNVKFLSSQDCGIVDLEFELLCQQMLCHSVMLILVLVLVQFFWMRLDAVVVKVSSLTAYEVQLSAVTRPIDIDGTTGGATASVHMEVPE